ncbi:hypothetical protein ACN42_g10456 [Penicillium freii]|uniref:Major facilitator superfamily (MFS) profile domain-containing protein n=1 Tax=Penicillium freii TaxID=48697 RepID=A0A124GQ18_PENFR|nr:hypothetical protein ACN42_g10456 [Penicillium freii]
MGDKKENFAEVLEPQSGLDVQHIEENLKASVADKINQGEDSELYLEAIQRYPNDEAIDKEAEKRLKRKLDMHLIPLLGICYFFYYVDKTTLSYAAIFGIKDDLNLAGSEYSWLSSIFYFGWLVWAIPSNLLMQRSRIAWYLAFNIFMWGVVLMCEAASHNFATLAALRIISGAFEAIADPAFMLVVSTYYTRAEQPWRISAYYLWNGIGVAGGGLIGYGIGNIKGGLQSWRYEFLIIGAVCAAWGIALGLLLPNSPATFWGFNRDEKLMMIARLRSNQTGIEGRKINWGQVKEAYLDYKTWLFTILGFLANVPNGGISNFSTLVIQGLGFDTLNTALLGIPQGVIVVIWIVLGGYANQYMPKNSRTLVCALFMVPTIAGALGFLLAPDNAYVGRLICFPFFYKSEQAPGYPLGIGSLLVANCLELMLFFVFRYAFIWENRRKEKMRDELRERGGESELIADSTAFADLTDIQNPNFDKNIYKNGTKHTTVRIRWWSPTQLLTHRRVA